ncbi:MAG TPA: UDP binding domain-containing protein, partial [Elusimicrobiota bacterium]|nr:UDP binding domain-containing protein [Elusimicrobiota bacterium]
LELLGRKGSKVVYNDPNIPTFPELRHHEHLRVKSVPVTPRELASKDAVLIVTDHSGYDYESIVRHAPLIVDTRNACGGLREWRDKIVAA